MRRKTAGVTLAVVAMVAGAAEANPAPAHFDAAVDQVKQRLALIDTMEGTIPGRAIVAVQAGSEPWVDVRGVTRVDGGEPVTADTPFYIASMTKAFVGLMAVRLDEMGIMPLDLTLAEAIPDARIDGIDTKTLTMRDLLTHQLGFSTGALNFRTAYTDRVPSSDYGAILSAGSEAREPGFRYDNLGYLIYSAALERRTGRSWRAWIDDVVFGPLGMHDSSARTSDFRAVTSGHVRIGDRWQVTAPKSDAVMHAAGGLVVSAGDMARWLSSQAGGKTPMGAATIAKAQAPQVTIEPEKGPLRCEAYAFGWRICQAFGETILEHGGTYVGQRSGFVVVPARGIGFATMFNSESMTGGLGQQLALIFLRTALTGEPAEPDAAAFAARYAEMAGEYRQYRLEREAKMRADEQWAGWAWSPDANELVPYTGHYRHPAFGELTVALNGSGLGARLNGTGMELKPAAPGLFGAVLATDPDMLPLRFEIGEGGAPIAAQYDDLRFERVHD